VPVARLVAILLVTVWLVLWGAGCAVQETEELEQEATPPVAAKAESHIQMGDVHLREGKYRSAMKQYMEADTLTPDDPELKLRIGIVYADHYKRYTDAIRYYQEAIRLKENYSEAYNNLGRVYLIQKRWDEAIAMFRKALGNLFYQTPERAYYGLAIGYRGKGDPDSAIENYLLAIELRSEFIPLRVQLGLYYLELVRYEEALQTFQRARSIVQNKAPDKQGASNAEKEEYRSALASVLYHEGRTLQKMGRYPEARDAYMNGLKIAPKEELRKSLQRELDSLPPE
jgi:tetratricopeptide (TPR) repeat protein